jgi:uroporphyrinogen decarboxylase
MNPKERFINACLNKEVDRPPVWMMRQAGRYLPEYRLIKEKHPTLEMMQTPEIACEITLQPVSILQVDAAILYSDILMIPDVMGMGLSFATGEGPLFEFAVDSADNFSRLNTQGINERLDYVFKTVKLCVEKLPKDYPLLGFAGAPFTVACYMIAGGSKKDFSSVKQFAWNQPKVFHELMQVLTDTTIAYLLEQANAGVAAVQLFDTWAGLLSAEDYAVLAKPYTRQIFQALHDAYLPSIHYIKGGDYLFDELSELPNDVMGVDWRVDLKTVRERLGNKHAIQGNLDPDILLTSPELIQDRLQAMIKDIPDPQKGYIINLGHGIHRFTPVKNAKHFIDQAKALFR